MKRRTVLSLMATGIVAAGMPGPLRAIPNGHGQMITRAERILAVARQNAGVPPLARQTLLMNLGRRATAHMQVLGETTHLDATGAAPDLRATRLGYAGDLLGEAVAETYGPPEEMVQGWLETDATRAVVLDPRARALGLAVAQGRGGRMWWALVTGTL